MSDLPTIEYAISHGKEGANYTFTAGDQEVVVGWDSTQDVMFIYVGDKMMKLCDARNFNTERADAWAVKYIESGAWHTDMKNCLNQPDEGE